MTESPDHSVPFPPDRSARDTSVISEKYATRWENGVLLIEALKSRLDDDHALLNVFSQGVVKKPLGVIISIPRPKYISSLLLVALRDISLRADKLVMPLVAVLHPKLRLLIQTFGLMGTVPTSVSMDKGRLLIREQILNRAAGRPLHASLEDETESESDPK